jgi:glutamate-ammonia-ligase adenylyltransferase
VYGDADLAEGFARVRHQILSLPREAKELAEQVQQMRSKMQQHLSRETDELLDLKQSPGGMVDIEFIAQYLVLLHTQHFPELSKWTDNVRIFETCAKLGLLAPEQAKGLTQSYLDIRDECHRCGLQGISRMAKKAEFTQDLSVVTKTWQQLFAR